MNKKYYRVTNLTDGPIEFVAFLGDRFVNDVLEVGEVCYGVNEHAVNSLRFYEAMGLISIEEADEFPPDANWLKDGF